MYNVNRWETEEEQRKKILSKLRENEGELPSIKKSSRLDRSMVRMRTNRREYSGLEDMKQNDV